MVEYRFAKKIDETLRHVPADVPRRALDVGCGIGEVMAMLNTKGFETLGVQPDPEMARIAREQLGVDAREQYFGPGLFPPNQFGLVFSNHVFEHLSDPLLVARGIAEVLAPGGVCVTYVPTYYRNRSWTARAWMNSGHNWLFTHETLGTLFLRAELEPIAHTYLSDSDELCLVVKKPLQARELNWQGAIHDHTPWAKVKYYHDVLLDVRAMAFTPNRMRIKAKAFREITGGRPRDVAQWMHRMVRTRVEATRLLLKSVLS